MQVPRLTKIVVNIGLGEALHERQGDRRRRRRPDDASPARSRWSPGPRRRSPSSGSATGNAIGVKVTLRGERMWDFLERLTRIALPRIRDFRGVPGTLVRRPRQLLAGPARAARLPGDRLRQDRPPARARDEHRHDGDQTDEESKRLLALLGMPFAQLTEEQPMAKKSMIAKAQRTPRFDVRALPPLLRLRPAARATCAASRCAASASGSAPCWASCRASPSRAGSPMNISDPIADMLTRIRNASRARHEEVADAGLAHQARHRPASSRTRASSRTSRETQAGPRTDMQHPAQVRRARCPS